MDVDRDFSDESDTDEIHWSPTGIFTVAPPRFLCWFSSNRLFNLYFSVRILFRLLHFVRTASLIMREIQTTVKSSSTLSALRKRIVFFEDSHVKISPGYNGIANFHCTDWLS